MQTNETETGRSTALVANNRGDELKQTPFYVFPEFKSMNDLINDFYRSTIIEKINEVLSNGDICSILGRSILTTKVEDDECWIKGIRYWRMNISDVVAEASVSLDLKVDGGREGDYTHTFTLYVSYAFDADDNFECEFFGIDAEALDPEGWWLDDHLMPFISAKSANIAAEQMWRKFADEALTDITMLKPDTLATAMGLEIITRNLPKSMDANYVLFFEDGKLPFYQECEKGETKPEPKCESIKAKTIVLNTTSCMGGINAFEIFEACFQYFWFYQFAKFNRLDCSLGRRMGSINGNIEKGTSLVDMMNNLCSLGAICLLLPDCLFKDKVFRAYRNAGVEKTINGYINHDGFRYNYVIYEMAKEFDVPRFRIRQRLVQMGEAKAAGANNYDPDLKKQFTPYCFFPESVVKGDRFDITRMQLYDVYKNSADLRELLYTGDFAFCDGLVCKNTAEFLARSNDGTVLTMRANASVHDCCLRFTREYSKKTRTISFNAERYMNTYSHDMAQDSKTILEEKKKHYDRLIQNMPDNFGEALDFLMCNNLYKKFDAQKLSNAAYIDVEIIKRILSGEIQLPEINHAVFICVALHLIPKVSYTFLKTAGIVIDRPSLEEFILDCLYMESVWNVKAFLRENRLALQSECPF